MRDVTEALLLFAQGAISGLPKEEPDFPAALRLLMAHESLRADEAALWPPGARSALGEILKALIMVVELDRMSGGAMHQDARLAAGTDAQTLGRSLVVCMCEKAADLESLSRRSRRAPR